ncbi:hypothetical protein [Treponema brennaborense]|nr:hypothetical protein [Treponema brennaborense]
MIQHADAKIIRREADFRNALTDTLNASADMRGSRGNGSIPRL